MNDGLPYDAFEHLYMLSYMSRQDAIRILRRMVDGDLPITDLQVVAARYKLESEADVIIRIIREQKHREDLMNNKHLRLPGSFGTSNR